MNHGFKLFTPGPVQLSEEILSMGSQQPRYFRTELFSEKMFRIERMFLEILKAKPNSRLVTLTASGTAAMESPIVNCFEPLEKLLIINGGSFGARFSEICRYHGQSYIEHKIPFGQQLRIEELSLYESDSIQAVLVNHHETSTGHLYDLKEIESYCDRNDLLFVVDAIGSFLADPIDLDLCNIDILIVSSHKGLSLPPGVSFLVLSERAIEKIQTTIEKKVASK